jgi:hypothetical protein
MRLARACCRESPGGSVCREFFRAIDGRREPAPSPGEGDLAPLFPDAAKGQFLPSARSAGQEPEAGDLSAPRGF